MLDFGKTLERSVGDTALAGDLVLCSFGARHFTPTVPLSTHVYEWVQVNLMQEVTLSVTPIQEGGGGGGGGRGK